MLSPINKIHVHNVRGIKDLEIPLCESDLLILGENGTGKSSIADAIELFFTEKIEKISGRQDVPPKDAIPFWGSDKERWVKIGLAGETEPVQFDYSNSSTRTQIPAKFVHFFQVASSRPFILHRYQLLAFIEARAADRYKRLSSLIGMDEIDEIVDVWKKVYGLLEKNYKNADEEEKNALTELQNWLKKEALSDTDVCDIVNQAIIPLGLTPIANRKDIIKTQNSLQSKFSRPIDFVRAEALRTILSRIEELRISLDSFLGSYELLFDDWQHFIAQVSNFSDAVYENILVDGRRAIDELSLENCPLCEAGITNRSKLLGRIDARLEGLHLLTHARQKMEERKNKTTKSLFGLQENIVRLRDSLAAGAMQDIIGLSKLQKELQALETRFEAQITFLDTVEVFRKNFEIDLFFESVSATKESINIELQNLSPNNSERNILTANDYLARVDEKWMDWEKTREVMLQELNKLEAIKNLYQQLIQARKDGIQRVLNGLQAEFIRLYNVIHPNEGHKAISILMSENKANSAELLAEMDGMKAIHPLAHYSEGHLDSMGLCIFLALIKKFNGDLKFIVLDDVLTSIDAGHRLRVAQLIATEFRDYQMIITTHDEFWANELSIVFKNSHLPLKTIRMNPWNQTDGATYSNYATTDWQYYKEQICSGRKLDAVAGTGRALERFLFTMRRNLHLEVPATSDDRYTIGDLYGPFFSWLGRKTINRPDFPDFRDRINFLIEELEDYWRFRNWSGAHYNQWGEQISAQEAKRFVEIVEELVSAMECPVCSAPVIYDIDAKVIRCPNCKPDVSQKKPWVYNSKWKCNAESIANTNYINPKRQREKPKTVTIITKNAMCTLLQDARRKFGLALSATEDDQYPARDIYKAFTLFLTENPRNDVEGWAGLLNGPTEVIARLISEPEGWDIDSLDESQSLEFLTAAQKLTGLLECNICGDLLCFDKLDKKYYCNQCHRQAVSEVFSAYWFIE